MTADWRSNDVLTPPQRRLVMSRIRGKNCKPELVVRGGLHTRGLRYRLEVFNLSGSPVMVFLGSRRRCLCTGASGAVSDVCCSGGRRAAQSSGNSRSSGLWNGTAPC